MVIIKEEISNQLVDKRSPNLNRTFIKVRPGCVCGAQRCEIKNRFDVDVNEQLLTLSKFRGSKTSSGVPIEVRTRPGELLLISDVIMKIEITNGSETLSRHNSRPRNSPAIKAGEDFDLYQLECVFPLLFVPLARKI